MNEGGCRRRKQAFSEDKEGTGVFAKGEEAVHGSPAEGTARGGPSEGGIAGVKMPQHTAHVQGIA